MSGRRSHPAAPTKSLPPSRSPPRPPSTQISIGKPTGGLGESVTAEHDPPQNRVTEARHDAKTDLRTISLSTGHREAKSLEKSDKVANKDQDRLAGAQRETRKLSRTLRGRKVSRPPTRAPPSRPPSLSKKSLPRVSQTPGQGQNNTSLERTPQSASRVQTILDSHFIARENSREWSSLPPSLPPSLSRVENKTSNGTPLHEARISRIDSADVKMQQNDAQQKPNDTEHMTETREEMSHKKKEPKLQDGTPQSDPEEAEDVAENEWDEVDLAKAVRRRAQTVAHNKKLREGLLSIEKRAQNILNLSAVMKGLLLEERITLIIDSSKEAREHLDKVEQGAEVALKAGQRWPSLQRSNSGSRVSQLTRFEMENIATRDRALTGDSGSDTD